MLFSLGKHWLFWFLFPVNDNTSAFNYVFWQWFYKSTYFIAVAEIWSAKPKMQCFSTLNCIDPRTHIWSHVARALFVVNKEKKSLCHDISIKVNTYLRYLTSNFHTYRSMKWICSRISYGFFLFFFVFPPLFFWGKNTKNVRTIIILRLIHIL